MASSTYVDTAFKEEVRRLKEDIYDEHRNPHGVNNLPHAIKVLSASSRGQLYKSKHNLTDDQLHLKLAGHLGVSEEDLYANMDNPGTLNSHVYHLDIPNKILNRLLNAERYTIKSVLALTYEQVLDIWGISEASTQHLIQAIKRWAQTADIDIQDYPLIQTMVDPAIWDIVPEEIKEYLDYPFTHILNHKEPIPIRVLDVTNGKINALLSADIHTLDELVRIPIRQWVTIKGLGRKTVMSLVLKLIKIDERIAQLKHYTTTVNMQLSVDMTGLNKEEIYAKTIDHLHQLLDDGGVDIHIDEKIDHQTD